MTQTEAIRKALDALGDHAFTDAIREWVKKRGTITTASFDSIVSHERRKRRKVPALASEQREEWLASLKEVKGLVERYGIKAFNELLESFERIHDQCGGTWQGVKELVEVLTEKPAGVTKTVRMEDTTTG